MSSFTKSSTLTTNFNCYNTFSDPSSGQVGIVLPDNKQKIRISKKKFNQAVRALVRSQVDAPTYYIDSNTPFSFIVKDENKVSINVDGELEYLIIINNEYIDSLPKSVIYTDKNTTNSTSITDPKTILVQESKNIHVQESTHANLHYPFRLKTPFKQEHRNLVVELAKKNNLLNGIQVDYSDERGFNLPAPMPKWEFLNKNEIWRTYHGNRRQLRFNFAENGLIKSLRYKDGIECWMFLDEVEPLIELIDIVVKKL